MAHDAMVPQAVGETAATPAISGRLWMNRTPVDKTASCGTKLRAMVITAVNFPQ